MALVLRIRDITRNSSSCLCFLYRITIILYKWGPLSAPLVDLGPAMTEVSKICKHNTNTISHSSHSLHFSHSSLILSRDFHIKPAIGLCRWCVGYPKSNHICLYVLYHSNGYLICYALPMGHLKKKVNDLELQGMHCLPLTIFYMADRVIMNQPFSGDTSDTWQPLLSFGFSCTPQVSLGSLKFISGKPRLYADSVAFSVGTFSYAELRVSIFTPPPP